MRKNTENLHPIVQFEVLSKCLGNLRAGPQEPEAQPAEYRKLLSRITGHMNCLLDEMEPEAATPTPPETSFKDACAIVAKRIHTIMQVRDLGEVNITFKPGKGDDWVTVQSRFSGRDKKKTRQYATLPFPTISEAMVMLEAQLMLDDPSVPNYHEQVMRAKPSEQAVVPDDDPDEFYTLIKISEIALLKDGLVAKWNRWYGKCPKAADLHEFDLSGVMLQGVNLGQANLQGANLQETDLRGSNLGEANLQGADLCKTDLRGSNLCGANLRGVDLDGVAVQYARYNDYTIFPDGFDPEVAAMVWTPLDIEQRCRYSTALK